MVFTSWLFVWFFLAVLLGLRLLRTQRTRQLFILLASMFFYAAWKAPYLLVLAVPSCIDYFCALRISATDDAKRRRLYLIVSIASNLALLGYFKYTNFFISIASDIFGCPLQLLQITLPIGISFFTFKALSYSIDVYRRQIPVCRDWFQFAMFITYFPELIAGPIVRASVFLPQMNRSLKFSSTRVRLGLEIILLGVIKKLLIADRLAPFCDAVFAHPGWYSSASNLMAVVAYSLQIYCDFSGYSDIAIGTSKIIGFDLPENFNMPYLATSLSDFWRRWHITLSTWLRDYLYIPLGGNRKGTLRTYVNLMLTMLLGGLWHGANWTFVAWGALHGVGLVVTRAVGHRIGFDLPKPIRWLLTYAFVCLTWIFFRAPNFTTAAIMLRKIMWWDGSGVTFLYAPFLMLLPLVLFAHWVGIMAARQAGERNSGLLAWPLPAGVPERVRFAIRRTRLAGVYVGLPRSLFLESCTLTAIALVLFLFAAIQTSPFIYFQF